MCKNDCILYCGPEYEDLEKCPICNSIDSIVERTVVMTRTAIEIEGKAGLKWCFHTFLSFPCLKHWFASKELELLRGHKEKHMQDAKMIRHPADATQWQNNDSQNPEFAIDPSNIRIAIGADGMNPFMNSSTHSTWSIMLTILNLPPWLCNKQKYIIMLELIPGPQ
jgi:hypothetical protein